jgi:protein-S-isoprenylcysteine O-methyltransferase Ste14
MSAEENVFRALAAAILLSVGLTRDGVRILGYLRRTPRPSFGDLVRDFVRNNRSARFGSSALLVMGSAFFAGLFLYIARPLSMAWSQIELPSIVRWLGAMIAALGGAGEIWALVYLGRQYSGLLRVRDDHVLIDGGPYAWVRHPIYSFAVPFLAGLGIMAASWFLLATGVLAILAIALQRVPEEEAMLLDAFGESYRRYMERTGRLFPRLFGPG